MLFTIIVPVYKVEQYLDRCVESLINQTYSDIEIILVDDGSPDRCPEMCDNYAKLDSRIKVIHKKNGGLSDARNAGIDASSGDYIVLVDSDDYLETNACEMLAKYADNITDIIMGDPIIEGSSMKISHIRENGYMTGEEYLLKAFKSNMSSMAACWNVMRREFLNDNQLRFKCGILHEDEEFTPRVILRAERIAVLNKAFYHYIIREDSITTKRDKRKNATDLYNTCLELEDIYNSLTNTELKALLLDSLVGKYLDLFHTGQLYRYGKKYHHKAFLKRNAYKKRTIYKVKLFCLNPTIYCLTNTLQKRAKYFCSAR